jgi:hypothetical protein
MADLTAHWRTLYANKYLGSWDLFDPRINGYNELNVRITHVHADEVIGEGGRKDHPVQLKIVGVKTGRKWPDMIVTRGNGTTLQKMFGEIPAKWVGKEITIYVRKNKKAQKGTGDVLTIRSTAGNQELREQLEPPGMPPEVGREPGQEG